MASISWSDVTAHAPELSTVSAGAQTDILAHVNVALLVTEFGGEDAPKTKMARIYLAAHLATMAAQGAAGAAGPVQSESAGGLSRTYAVGAAALAGGDYETTSYGQAFRALARTTPARIPMLL